MPTQEVVPEAVGRAAPERSFAVHPLLVVVQVVEPARVAQEQLTALVHPGPLARAAPLVLAACLTSRVPQPFPPTLQRARVGA